MNQQLEESQSQFELEVYGLAYLAEIECQYFLIILTISDYLSDIVSRKRRLLVPSTKRLQLSTYLLCWRSHGKILFRSF